MTTTPTTKPTLADTLIAIRRAYGLSQSQAAYLIPHMPLKTLQKYEQQGSEPPTWVQLLLIDTLIKKCQNNEIMC